MRHARCPTPSSQSRDAFVVIDFYRKIRRNIKEDGLIVSSSGFLAKAMVREIDFSRPLRILEIGSGKGVITREIIRRMAPGSVLDVCEIKAEYNPWIERLIADHPDKQIHLYNHCITELLEEREEYDVIVSSLPLKNFADQDDRKAFLYRVLECFRRSLKEGGTYMQYQYFRSNKSDIELIFGKSMDAVSFVLLNILPAFVYSMTKNPGESGQNEA